MRQILPILLSISLLFQFNFDAKAQLPPGATAPDWTLTDINGNTHNLYSMLNDGKYVFIEVSATWCGPCWNFHNTGTMEAMYNLYGPNGTDEARVFFIEGDLSTPLSCLFGNCSNTWGNWVAGTSFPFINLTANNGPGFTSDYQIAYFPTIYVVCPDKRVYEVGQIDENEMATYMTSCDMMESGITTTEENCFGDGSGSIDLSVQGGVTPISYNWSNGENTQDLNGISAGNYMVTMTDQNNVSYSTSVTLDGPTSALTIQEDALDLELDCFGDADGLVHLTPNGGTPSYSANWSDGSTQLDRNNLQGGTFNVTVSDANGCTETESYTVNEPPQLTLALDKLDASCGLANGFILAESNGGTGQHTYNIGQGNTYNPLFEDLQPGNYSVTVTDNNNCSEMQSEQIVNVPGPEAEAPADMQLDCEGNSIVIDASASNVTNGTNILWTTDDGNIVSGENTLMPTVDATGTYKLTLSNPQTCSDETETVVNLNPDQPVADAGEDKEVSCSTPQVTIGSDNSSSGSNIEYKWFDDDSNEIGTTQFIDVNSPGVYTLYVTNTDLNCTSSATVDITNAGDEVNAVANVNGMLTCAVEAVTLNSDGSSSGDHVLFSWLDPNGNEIGTGASIDVSSSGEYTLIVTDTSIDCSSEQSITVEVNRENPDIEVMGETILSCSQSELELTVATNNIDSNYSVVWKNEEGEIISTEHMASVSRAGEYIVTVTNELNGCTSEERVIIANDDDLPRAEVASPALLTCLVDEVVLDGSSSSSGSNITYQWMTSDGNIVGDQTQAIISASTPGTYTLVVTNTDNGCAQSIDIIVEGYSEPPSASPIFETGHFNVATSANIDGYSNDVHWDFGDGTTSNELEAFHQYNKQGVYTICLTLSNDCGETMICEDVYISANKSIEYEDGDINNAFTSNPVLESPAQLNEKASTRSIQSMEGLTSFTITPNPANNHMMINWSMEEEMNVELRIMDLSGKIVFNERYSSSKEMQERIQVAQWNQGLYIVQMITKRGTAMMQVVKQ